MFDLKNGIGEKRNISGKHEQQAHELHERLIEWRTQVNASVSAASNPEYDGASDREMQLKRRACFPR